MKRRARRLGELLAIGGLALASSEARADPLDPAASSSAASARDDAWSAVDGAAAAGAFSPLTLSAVLPPRASVYGYAGYDAGRGSAAALTFAEVRVWRMIGFRAGFEFGDTAERLRPSVGARL